MERDRIPTGGSTETLNLTDVMTLRHTVRHLVACVQHRTPNDLRSACWKLLVPLSADVHERCVSPSATITPHQRVCYRVIQQRNGGNVTANVLTGVTMVPHAERWPGALICRSMTATLYNVTWGTFTIVLLQVWFLQSSSCHPSVRESTVDWSLISGFLIKDQILITSMQKWKHPPSPIIEIHFMGIFGCVYNVQHVSIMRHGDVFVLVV